MASHCIRTDIPKFLDDSNMLVFLVHHERCDGESILKPLRNIAIVLAAIVLATISPAEQEADPASSHLVVSERDLEKLEERLKSAGARGFRLMGATAGLAGYVKSSPLELQLERPPKREPIEYRIVSGQYSGKLEKRINDAALEGYRVRPDGVLRHVSPNVLGRTDSESVVLIMERDLGLPSNEYRLLSPGTPKQFDRQMASRHQEGFRFTGARGMFDGWLLVVVERPITEQERVEPPPEEDPHYRAIDRRDRQKLFDSVGEAAKRGYRILTTVHRGFTGGGDVVLLEKATEPGRPYSYFFLGRPDDEGLEERLNEGGAAAYRFLQTLDPRVELIMGRAPNDSGAASYRIVSAVAASQVADELAAARRDGYAYVGIYGNSLVLEKTGAASSDDR
jgi:hypothetical protein